MSNSVTSIRDSIFNQLLSHIQPDDVHRITKVKRHINFPPEEKEQIVKILKECRFKEILRPRLNLLFLEYDSIKYIALPSQYENIVTRIGLDIETDTCLVKAAGALLISTGCLQINNEITSLQLINSCFGLLPTDGSSDISFQFQEIIDFFISYILVRIDINRFSLEYQEDFNRLYGILTADDRSLISQSTKEFLRNILLLESSRSIAASIISCMESPFYEYAYLQLYQCFEYLFIIDRGFTLAQDFTISTITGLEIAMKNDFKISEEASLLLVIKNYSPQNKTDDYYKKLISSTPPENCDMKSSIANRIYKHRCLIAHLRYNQNDEHRKTKWVEEIEALSELLFETYNQIESKLTQLHNTKNSWEIL